MINLSQETEALIQAKAARTGRTADEILREALVRTGDVLTWRSSVEPPPAGLTKGRSRSPAQRIQNRPRRKKRPHLKKARGRRCRGGSEASRRIGDDSGRF